MGRLATPVEARESLSFRCLGRGPRLAQRQRVNNRVVLVGAEQDFFLDLLEMLVPGGATDPLLSLDDAVRGQLPPPPTGPFEVKFGLSEVTWTA
jgi:hypothetical protein